MVSSTPRPHFTPGKDPVPILQEAGWAPGPVWTGGKSRPHRDSIPDCPARSSVAIPTELPGPQLPGCGVVYFETGPTIAHPECFTVAWADLEATYNLCLMLKTVLHKCSCQYCYVTVTDMLYVTQSSKLNINCV